MSKKKAKKKKNVSNKKAKTSSNIKKTKDNEGSVDSKKINANSKKNDVEKIKSDTGKVNINNKKTKNNDSCVKADVIKEAEIDKKIIRQGNKLIFKDAGDKANPDNVKVPDTNLHNTDRGSFFENKLELAVMSKKERRAAKKAAYREYTSTMSGKERVSYFFYCYKWHIIIPICCVLLILCYGIAFYKNSRPVALSYAILNADESDKTFHGDYLSYFNLPESHVVQVITGYFVDYDYYKNNTASASKDGTSYNTLALTCQMGNFDVIIGDGAGIKYCTFVNIVKPLDLYFTAEQYAALEDYIVKFQDSSYTFYPYAIDISDTEFAKGLNLGYPKVYMAFPGVSEENMTNSLRLLEYVLGIELVE